MKEEQRRGERRGEKKEKKKEKEGEEVGERRRKGEREQKQIKNQGIKPPNSWFPLSILFASPFFLFSFKAFSVDWQGGSLGSLSPMSLTPFLSPTHPLPSTLAEGQALPQPHPPPAFRRRRRP